MNQNRDRNSKRVQKIGYDSARRGIRFNVYCGYNEKDGRRYVNELKSKAKIACTGFAGSSFKISWENLPLVTGPTGVIYEADPVQITVPIVTLTVEALVEAVFPPLWVFALATAGHFMENLRVPATDLSASYGVQLYNAFSFTDASGAVYRHYVMPPRLDPTTNRDSGCGNVVPIVEQIRTDQRETGSRLETGGAEINNDANPESLTTGKGAFVYTASHMYLQLSTPNWNGYRGAYFWLPLPHYKTDGKLIIKYNLKTEMISVRSSEE